MPKPDTAPSVEPVTLNLGFELTFLPRPSKANPWPEWRSKEQARRIAAEFNRRLRRCSAIVALKSWDKWGSTTLPVWAKEDIFRSQKLSSTPQPHDAWCIEVNNIPMCSDYLFSDMGTTQKRAVEAVFTIAAALGLVPRYEERPLKSAQPIKEFPTGGSHIHVGLDIWFTGSRSLMNLWLLERYLCLDYANHPWLRWMFGQWLDDTNHADALTNDQLTEVPSLRRRKISDDAINDTIHEVTLGTHSIVQRCTSKGKPPCPTMEFRFFDMVDSSDELFLHVHFLTQWISYWVRRLDAFEESKVGDPLGTYIFDLTPTKRARLVRDPEYAQRQARAFMAKIGVAPEIVQKIIDAFWERCYIRRVKYGKT